MSRTSTVRENDGVFGRAYQAGEEAMGQIIQGLLSNKAVSDRLASTMHLALDARRRLDRNMQVILTTFNLPSRADYQRLLRKVETLQGSLVNLNMKLDRILAAQQETVQAAGRREQGTGHRPTATARRRQRRKS